MNNGAGSIDAVSALTRELRNLEALVKVGGGSAGRQQAPRKTKGFSRGGRQVAAASPQDFARIKTKAKAVKDQLKLSERTIKKSSTAGELKQSIVIKFAKVVSDFSGLIGVARSKASRPSPASSSAGNPDHWAGNKVEELKKAIREWGCLIEDKEDLFKMVNYLLEKVVKPYENDPKIADKIAALKDKLEQFQIEIVEDRFFTVGAEARQPEPRPAAGPTWGTWGVPGQPQPQTDTGQQGRTPTDSSQSTRPGPKKTRLASSQRTTPPQSPRGSRSPSPGRQEQAQQTVFLEIKNAMRKGGFEIFTDEQCRELARMGVVDIEILKQEGIAALYQYTDLLAEAVVNRAPAPEDENWVDYPGLDQEQLVTLNRMILAMVAPECPQIDHDTCASLIRGGFVDTATLKDVPIQAMRIADQARVFLADEPATSEAEPIRTESPRAQTPPAAESIYTEPPRTPTPPPAAPDQNAGLTQEDLILNKMIEVMTQEGCVQISREDCIKLIQLNLVTLEELNAVPLHTMANAKHMVSSLEQATAGPEQSEGLSPAQQVILERILEVMKRENYPKLKRADCVALIKAGFVREEDDLDVDALRTIQYYQAVLPLARQGSAQQPTQPPQEELVGQEPEVSPTREASPAPELAEEPVVDIDALERELETAFEAFKGNSRFEQSKALKELAENYHRQASWERSKGRLEDLQRRITVFLEGKVERGVVVVAGADIHASCWPGIFELREELARLIATSPEAMVAEEMADSLVLEGEPSGSFGEPGSPTHSLRGMGPEASLSAMVIQKQLVKQALLDVYAPDRDAETIASSLIGWTSADVLDAWNAFVQIQGVSNLGVDDFIALARAGQFTPEAIEQCFNDARFAAGLLANWLGQAQSTPLQEEPVQLDSIQPESFPTEPPQLDSIQPGSLPAEPVQAEPETEEVLMSLANHPQHAPDPWAGFSAEQRAHFSHMRPRVSSDEELLYYMAHVHKNIVADQAFARMLIALQDLKRQLPDMSFEDCALCLNAGLIRPDNADYIMGRLVQEGPRVAESFAERLDQLKGGPLKRSRTNVQGYLDTLNPAEGAKTGVICIPPDANAFYGAIGHCLGLNPGEVRARLDKFVRTVLVSRKKDPVLYDKLKKGKARNLPTREELMTARKDKSIATLADAGDTRAALKGRKDYLPLVARALNTNVVLVTKAMDGRLTTSVIDVNGERIPVERLQGGSVVKLVHHPEAGHFDAFGEIKEGEQPAPEATAEPVVNIDPGASVFMAPPAPAREPEVLLVPEEEEEILEDESVDHLESLNPQLLQNIRQKRARESVPLENVGRHLYDLKLIRGRDEFETIIRAWGDNTLLQKPDFPQKYAALCRLNYFITELQKAGRIPKFQYFTYQEQAMLHRSNVIEQWINEINSAASWDEAERVVLGVDRDYGLLLNGKDQRLTWGGLNLEGPALHNWGQNCWINSSLNLVMNMLSDVDIENLKARQFDDVLGGEAAAKSALRDAVIETWLEYQKIMRGATAPHSMAGYQKKLMKCMYDVGQIDQLGARGLREVFPNAFPGDQEDAGLMLNGLMEALGLNHDKRYGIGVRNYVTGTYKGRNMRRSVDAQHYPSVILPVASRPNGLDLAAEVISPEGMAALRNRAFPTRQQRDLRDAIQALNHELTRTDRPDAEKRDRDVRNASEALEAVLKPIAMSVSRPDALIVDRNMVLQADCVVDKDTIIRKGTQLPGIGGEIDLPHCRGQRRYGRGRIEQAPTGEMLIMYPEQAGRYAKGIAVIDDSGRLLCPYLQQPTGVTQPVYEPFPRRTLGAGATILSGEGKTLKPTFSGADFVPAGHTIVDPELARMMRYGDLDMMRTEERADMAIRVAKMMGVNEGEIDRPKLADRTKPITLKECLDEYTVGAKESFEWYEDQFEAQGIGIEEWYPDYLRRKNIDVDTVYTPEMRERGEDIAACFRAHKATQKKGQVYVKIPGQTIYGLESDRNLRRFVVSFTMFETRNGVERKRSGQVLDAFLNGGDPVSIPMKNEDGRTRNVKGALRTLVCHSGSAKEGHYISLSFQQDGRIMVHDDDVVINFKDYLRMFPGYNENWDYKEFLMNTSFTPYIGMYSRD